MFCEIVGINKSGDIYIYQLGCSIAEKIYYGYMPSTDKYYLEEVLDVKVLKEDKETMFQVQSIKKVETGVYELEYKFVQPKITYQKPNYENIEGMILKSLEATLDFYQRVGFKVPDPTVFTLPITRNDLLPGDYIEITVERVGNSRFGKI